MAFQWDLGDEPSQQLNEVPQKPQQATLSGNPLVDFFSAGFGGAVRGAESDSGNAATAFGTLANMQGLKDWGAKVNQDVATSTPDYTGHNVLGALNAVGENVGGAIAPIAAGFVGAAAAPEEIAGGAAMAASAAAMAPIGFGAAKTEAIQRGADEATANNIGIEVGGAQAALFMLPMHQILSSGGPILERILANAAVNAGVGGALSYGQEELMKANDLRPTPNGEFNNTVYSTVIGGLTGMVFGAFSPDEMTPHINAIVDTHIMPQVQAQLEAQYVAQGMDPDKAKLKALDMVTDKRPQMIKETQDMYMKARFSVSNLLKGNYDIVNKDTTPEPMKVYSRDPAGNKSEYELTYMNAPKETNELASKIINAAFSVVKTEKRMVNGKPDVDASGKEILDAVIDPVTKIPIIEKTMTAELPNIARVLLHDSIVKQLQAGDDTLKLYNAIKQRTLPILNRHALIYTGAAHGKPSETQNSLYHFNMGVRTIAEVAKNMLDSNGLMHPEIATIYHMGDEEGVDQAWKLLHKSFGDQGEMRRDMNEKYPAPLPSAPAPDPHESQMVEHLLNQVRDLMNSGKDAEMEDLLKTMSAENAKIIMQRLMQEHMFKRATEAAQQAKSPQEIESAAIKDQINNEHAVKDKQKSDAEKVAAYHKMLRDQAQEETNKTSQEAINSMFKNALLEEKVSQHIKDAMEDALRKDVDMNVDGYFKDQFNDDPIHYINTMLGSGKNLSPQEEELVSKILFDESKDKSILESTPDEKKVANEWNQTIDPNGQVNMNDKEAIAKALADKTRDKDAQRTLVDKIFEMNQQRAPALQAHAEVQLGPQMTGEPIQPKELDQANPRTLPLKLMLGAASMFGRKTDFLNWARGHYGQEYAQKFTVPKPVGLAEEIIQGFKTDKTTKDLIRHIATDNLAPAMKESWRIATGLTGMLAQKGLVKDTKIKTIQDVNRKFGELISLAAEERRANGEKTYLGIQRQLDPSGKDDNFQKKYMEHLAFWGMPPQDPQTLGTRPELAFTTLMHDLAGDHAEKLLMWIKNEMEEPSFQAMVKAGVFDQTNIMANVAFGYSPRVHDLKGAQKEYQKGKGVVGDPTKSSGLLQRDAFDYSDFLVRSEQQGLDTVPHYLDAMSEYVQQSLAKSMQYNILNWLRMFRIPNTDSLGIPGHNTPEVRDVIKNLNYVEYASSHNIQKLSELTGKTANEVLGHLGYFNKKDAEGLVGWDKFHFEKPFMQGALSDVLDFYYPKVLQNETISTITGVLNVPKYMMVTLDPLQHVALFSTAVLGNSGWRLPIVMGRWAKHSAIALANMPFALKATLKGEPQTRLPTILGGGPIEPGYENQENLAKFLTYGHGAALGAFPEGLFQDLKIQKYLIPEMMSGRQGWDAALQSTLGATKIMFGHFLQKEIYNVTNERYNEFRNKVGPDGQKLMTDDEAARRAVNLINSTSGVVHPSDFGPFGPAWSILTFARGLTIATLRVITGTIEPTLRKIYGNTNKFKIDPVSGMLNPIRMGDLSAKDADFLQAYYAQHLAKIMAMRLLAAGVVQYSMSFLDDDKKDEFGQEGHDPLNSKRFIFNNPAGFKMAIRTPWTDINGRRKMMNPTPFREASQLVDMTGLGSKYKFPESTSNWIKNRLNVWEQLLVGAFYGVDVGTGQDIPGKGTDEYLDEVTKWMMSKTIPLSLGWTQEEKEQRTGNSGEDWADRIGAFFGTTPTVAPKGWFPSQGNTPGYDEFMRINKEAAEKKLEARAGTNAMTADQILKMKPTAFLSEKDIHELYNKKINSAQDMINKMKRGADKIQAQQQEQQAQLMQTVGQTGE